MIKLLTLFTVWIFVTPASILADGNPPQKTSFDASKGFKPAQTNLTQIFLQIAESLDAYGNPIPYLRHAAQEDARIEALYRKKLGAAPSSLRPAYMTDEYIDRLAANWNLLSPKLGLDTYAKDVGRMMCDAINGKSGASGTILVTIFNQHQASVLARMTGNGDGPSDFEALKAQLISQLQLDKDEVSDAQDEPARRDAIDAAHGIRTETLVLFKRLDQSLAPADAKKIETVLTAVILDVGQIAQSELEAGNLERALQEQSVAAELPARPYSADQETALSADERQEYAALLSKSHFTKADFKNLEAFYSGPYDRLSERGKDELSFRVWGGVRSSAAN
jgi:hypothetical protein